MSGGEKYASCPMEKILFKLSSSTVFGRCEFCPTVLLRYRLAGCYLLSILKLLVQSGRSCSICTPLVCVEPVTRVVDAGGGDISAHDGILSSMAGYFARRHATGQPLQQASGQLPGPAPASPRHATMAQRYG